MAHGGFFLVYRSLTSPRHDLHPRSTGEEACRAWAWTELIGMAAWEETEDLGVGELRASVRELSRLWNWSRGRVYRFLQELEEKGRIERPGTQTEQKTGHKLGRKAGRIRICNYEGLQNPRDARRDASWDGPRDTSGTHTSIDERTNKTGVRARARGNGNSRWQDALAVARREAEYLELDQETQAAIQAIGGLNRIRLATTSQLPRIRSDFYAALKRGTDRADPHDGPASDESS